MLLLVGLIAHQSSCVFMTMEIGHSIQGECVVLSAFCGPFPSYSLGIHCFWVSDVRGDIPTCILQYLFMAFLFLQLEFILSYTYTKYDFLICTNICTVNKKLRLLEFIRKSINLHMHFQDNKCNIKGKHMQQKHHSGKKSLVYAVKNSLFCLLLRNCIQYLLFLNMFLKKQTVTFSKYIGFLDGECYWGKLYQY